MSDEPPLLSDLDALVFLSKQFDKFWVMVIVTITEVTLGVGEQLVRAEPTQEMPAHVGVCPTPLYLHAFLDVPIFAHQGIKQSTGEIGRAHV